MLFRSYVQPSSGSTSKVAVVLGYGGRSKTLPGGVLTIPAEVDAYKRLYSTTSNEGFVAVNKDGDFLYYAIKVDATDSNGDVIYETNPDGSTKVDSEGNPITKKEIVYRPCAYEDRAQWESLANDAFYYDDNGTYQLTTSDSKQRIHNAQVAYIGNQYLETIYDNTDPDTILGWNVVEIGRAHV